MIDIEQAVCQRHAELDAVQVDAGDVTLGVAHVPLGQFQGLVARFHGIIEDQRQNAGAAGSSEGSTVR